MIADTEWKEFNKSKSKFENRFLESIEEEQEEALKDMMD